MWLPLALADVVTLLVAVMHRAAGDNGKLDLPKRSEVLKGWALPMMSAALKEDEDEEAAMALLHSVQNLAKRANGFENRRNGGQADVNAERQAD